ncbi:MAG: hypothetical protein KBT28_06920 [Bacteroidales bacterium]|nr:hypothetical protein [Candidatus Colimorpha merdihippi]
MKATKHFNFEVTLSAIFDDDTVSQSSLESLIRAKISEALSKLNADENLWIPSSDISTIENVGKSWSCCKDDFFEYDTLGISEQEFNEMIDEVDCLMADNDDIATYFWDSLHEVAADHHLIKIEDLP